MALILLCLLAAACRAETLKDLLLAQGVPLDSFREDELAEPVQGRAASDARKVVIGYRKLAGERLVGPRYLLRYDKDAHTVIRNVVHEEENDICSGSVSDVEVINHFAFLSTSLSPSAECLQTVGDDLKLQHTFYGFGPVEVLPNQVVITEDMRHWAPTHPERLQLADLMTGRTTELYPAKGDILRAKLIRRHKKLLPPSAVCMAMNDPCDAADFDERLQPVRSDGKGMIAFLAQQTASHAVRENESPITVASQDVLYIYKRDRHGWRYCEVAVPEAEVEAISRLLTSDFSKVARRCTPRLLVVPDMSTAGSNPFLSDAP